MDEVNVNELSTTVYISTKLVSLSSHVRAYTPAEFIKTQRSSTYLVLLAVTNSCVDFNFCVFA